MQCPKCNYEPTLAEIQKSPNDCVSCGINFDGYERSVAEGQRQRSLAETEKEARKVALLRERRFELEMFSDRVRSAMDGYEGAKPVVVVDVHMSFNSMVWFMVKWVVASIPAFIILAVIFVMLTAFFGGFLGAFNR